MANEYQYIDLSYISTMTGGNSEILKDLAGLFRSEIPKYVAEMREYLEKSEWDNLAGIAHKSKSSVAIMGLQDLAGDLKDLELMAKKKENIERYKKIVDRFEEVCNKAIEELSHAANS